VILDESGRETERGSSGVRRKTAPHTSACNRRVQSPTVQDASRVRRTSRDMDEGRA